MHPQRLPDELLSFWILRSAHANRIKLQTFTNTTFGRSASPWCRDIDRSATLEFLATLSERTGAPIDDLRAGMLSSYEGIVFERHTAFGNTPWILPLGIYHRTRRAFGMQFCPTCLFWDTIPYFRKRWRLAFATICDKHGTLLQDRCPQCASPVTYFRNDLGRRNSASLGDHTLCWQCGFDLRRAPAFGGDWLDAETYIALRSFLTFIDNGLAVAGSHDFQYAHLFLQGLRRVCEMLASTGKRRRYDRLQRAVSAATGLALPHGEGRGTFESFSLYERHRVLLSALWMLMDWPARFVRVCNTAGISWSFVLADLDVAPYWFEHALKAMLDKSGYVVSPDEARHAAAYLEKNAIPVTKNAVQKLLGGRDHKAAQLYKIPDHSPWPESDEEFQELLLAADVQIQSLMPSSVNRLLAERDRMIFQVMRHTRWSITKILGTTLAEIMSLLAPGCSTLPTQLKDLLLDYLKSSRPALVGSKQFEKLFVGIFTDGIGPERVGQIIRQLKTYRP